MLGRAVEESDDKKETVGQLEIILRDAARGAFTYESHVVRKAVHALEKADDVYGKMILARFLKTGGSGVPPDTARAADIFTKAMDKVGYTKDSWALEVAVDVVKDGLWDDAPEVEKWIRGTETVGSLTAKIKLALMLKRGATAVPPDASRANVLLQREIEVADFHQTLRILQQLIKNVTNASNASPAKSAFADIAQAAEQCMSKIDEYGSSNVRYELERILSDGGTAMRVDAPSAVRLLTRAIDEVKYGYSRKSLALLLENGRPGVPADAPPAVELYKKGIEMGIEKYFVFNLAVLLQHGSDGIEIDAAQYASLYEDPLSKHCYYGSPQNNLAVLLEHGAPGLRRDVVRAAELYRKQIDLGEHCGALYNLAVLLKHGSGVGADPTQATELFILARNIGGPV